MREWLEALGPAGLVFVGVPLIFAVGLLLAGCQIR